MTMKKMKLHTHIEP